MESASSESESNQSEYSSTAPNKKRKTNAQYQKQYRECEKAKKTTENVQKTATQLSQGYGARKKAKIDKANSNTEEKKKMLGELSAHRQNKYGERFKAVPQAQLMPKSTSKVAIFREQISHVNANVTTKNYGVMRQANVIFSTILTKMGNGKPLEQCELDLIETRFFKKSEAERLCPNGVRLFFQNKDVNAYNNHVLQQSKDRITSTANDVITGTKSHQQESICRARLNTKSVGDTDGLPYEIKFVINKYYMITANTDESDGLCNGIVGKLVHIDFAEDNTVSRVWLEFCDSENIGHKKRKKADQLKIHSKVSSIAVPIELRTASIPLTSDKKIVAKRKHFPLIAACAMTIHKSQGGIYDEIVYEYGKGHSQELVYVALSRVTSIDGLYLVTSDDDETKFRYHHNRVQVKSTDNLLQEFKRLSLDTLKMKAQMIIDFISEKKGILASTFNVQSLRSHSLDISDTVTRKTNVLLLSETNMSHSENYDIPNFNCIVRYKQNNVRSGRVAIYQHSDDEANIVTPNMSIFFRNINHFSFQHSHVGDIGSAVCQMGNGVEVVMAVVYISENQKILDIEEFILRALLEYSKEGSKCFEKFGKNYGGIPLILAGDFNIDFQKKELETLKQFLFDTFDLRMNNDSTQGTTHTTIDTVFSRYLQKLESQTYISYFSYHKPKVSMLKIEENSEDVENNLVDGNSDTVENDKNNEN